MISPEEVLEVTGHPVGGVCPFRLKHPMDICLDVTLKRFDKVFPSARSPHSPIEICR